MARHQHSGPHSATLRSNHLMRGMRTYLPITLIGALVAVTGPLQARPAEPEGSARVRVSVFSSGEEVEVRVASNEPFGEPLFRNVGHPSHLQLVLPHCFLLSRGGRQAIDKGVLQNVNIEATESGSVTIDLYALSTPQSKATYSADHQSLLWTVMTNVPSSAGTLPSLRVGSTAHISGRPAPVVAKPRPVHPATPVASVPLQPSAPTPQAPARVEPAHVEPAQAAKPAPTAKPVVASKPAPAAKAPPSQPVAPVKVVAAAPPAREATPPPRPAAPVSRPSSPVAVAHPSKPSFSNPGDRPVSFTYNGGDLAAALTALAGVAHIEAHIDPAVRGYVNVSYTDIPLNQVITSILGQQTELYTYKLTASSLDVFASGSGSGGQTVHPVISSAGVVSDYFPVKQKPVADVYEAARRTFPELTYQVDERLNVLFAEGDPAVMERLRKLLQNVSAK
jgi:hypothetical protein